MISVEVSPRAVATVLLNRPDRGNAFDQRMLDELAGQFAALGAAIAAYGQIARIAPMIRSAISQYALLIR